MVVACSLSAHVYRLGRGVLTLALTASASADVLETRDGRMLEGSYRGGTQQAVRFEVGGKIPKKTFSITTLERPRVN